MADDLLPPPLDPTPWLPLVDAALVEDHARDDITATALVPADATAIADVVAKETGTVAGLPLARAVFARLDEALAFKSEYEDGDTIGEKNVLFTVSGNARAILAGERTALNFLGRLCGIATRTAAFVEAAMATGARVLDTRKTTPGWRALEKHAVRCGGGMNHRMDLADAAMVKENHVLAACGKTGADAIAEVVRTARAALPEGKTLHVEVESHEEMLAAAAAGADVVMLDDFDLGAIRKAVRAIREMPAPRPRIEITGGVDEESIEAFAAAGAQRVSIGAITHSAPALDLSMRFRRQEATS